MRVPVLACVVLLVSTGCAYKQASLRQSDYPELRSVHLYRGKLDTRGVDLETVEVQRDGQDCSDTAAGALLELLAKARAVGGDGVKNVKFRGPWHWSGSILCRPRGFGVSVWTYGTAYQDLPGEAEPAAAQPGGPSP